MAPLLSKGASVEYQTPTHIKAGNIIIYKNNHQLKTIHRVIRIKGEFIVPKGDNRIESDAPIRYGQIVGQVIKVTSNHKTISLNSTKGKFLDRICLLYSVLYHLIHKHHPILAGKIKFKVHQLINLLFF